MSKTPELLGVSVRLKTFWLYRGWWLVIALATLTVAAVLLFLGLTLKHDDFLQLGLLQPAIAAILAFVAVLSLRLLGGPFTNERRKGVESASSTAIAVRLWALSFALLMGAMLLSAVVSRLPTHLTGQPAQEGNTAETNFEVNVTSSSTSVRLSAENRR